MKRIVFLLIVVICLTGCVKVDRSSYINTINQVLDNKTKLHNETRKGYNYYLPKGIKVFDSNDTNDILLYNNSRMYLYVDVVSFYEKVQNEFVKKDNVYYSEEIKNGDNFGYIEITKFNNGYFIEEMYNYAKIECFTSEDKISDTLLNITSILKSISYKESVISSLIGKSNYNYKEEVYNIFKPVVDEDNYLNFEEDIYENYTGEIKDEDSIIIEDGIE